MKALMIAAISSLDWLMFFFVGPTKRARLEAWAYKRGWLKMYRGRKEDIEYYLAHKEELEEYWNDPISCIIKERTRLQFENQNLQSEIQRLKSSSHRTGY